MANFRFRLTTLLKLREMTRDERRTALGQAMEAERLLTQQIDQAKTDIEETKRQAKKKSAPGELNVDLLLTFHRHELTLAAHVKQLEAKRQQILAEVERRRLALVEADREVRVLEKLREKQSERHTQLELKLEGKMLDEIAGMGASRLEAQG